jgi:hypothetical protein
VSIALCVGESQCFGCLLLLDVGGYNAAVPDLSAVQQLAWAEVHCIALVDMLERDLSELGRGLCW